jgi:hypothetical protein
LLFLWGIEGNTSDAKMVQKLGMEADVDGYPLT